MLKRNIRATVALATFLAMVAGRAAPAQADTCDWAVVWSQYWNEAGAWSPHAPGGGDTAVVNNEGTAVISDYQAAVQALRLGEVREGSRHDIGVVDIWDSGSLAAGQEIVGVAGSGWIRQWGGSNTVAGDLVLGQEAGGLGFYVVQPGVDASPQVTSRNLYVGYEGGGQFTQLNGHVQAAEVIVLGYGPAANGSWGLTGPGQLLANEMTVGRQGKGTFFQSTGSVSVVGALSIGSAFGGDGTYEIAGGQLSVGSLQVGLGGAGLLKLTAPAATATVTGTLSFGAGGAFIAAPGTKVHMAGAAFENASQDPVAMAGLGELELVFEGGPAATDSFEAAGEDRGAALAGWDDNFALGRLTLGGSAAGRIRLADANDNQGDGVTAGEALYVDWLVMNAGASVNTQGLKLYYLNGADPKEFFGGDATLNGRVDVSDLSILAGNYRQTTGQTWATADFNGDGAVNVSDLSILAGNYRKSTVPPAPSAPVPEPATLALLALGAVGALRRRRA